MLFVLLLRLFSGVFTLLECNNSADQSSDGKDWHEHTKGSNYTAASTYAAKDNGSFVVCLNASHQTNNGEYRAYAEDEV